MLNQHIISPEIATLSYSQTVAYALNMMEELQLEILPVVNDGIYIGLLAEEQLLDASPEELLSALQYDMQAPAVLSDDHFLSAAKLCYEQHLKIVPVITMEKEYAGCISGENLLRQFCKLNGVNEKGALVVIEMDRMEYSISQLSKLVETNDATILQLNTVTDELTGNLIATIRINKEEISDIVATFQRYDYRVLFHAGEEQYENELRRNYHHLMNFLAI